MHPKQEREIADGLRQGKTEAWGALYDAYAEPIWQCVARLMGPQRAEVADVVQETFLAAARSARTFDPSRGTLWVWLGGIVRRQVALHFRAQQRHDRLRATAESLGANHHQVLRWLEGREEPPERTLATAELRTLVRAAMTELPEDYEMLLTAKYFDGISVDEIAGQENCSATAVRSKLARARQAFRQAFAETVTQRAKSIKDETADERG